MEENAGLRIVYSKCGLKASEDQMNQTETQPPIPPSVRPTSLRLSVPPTVRPSVRPLAPHTRASVRPSARPGAMLERDGGSVMLNPKKEHSRMCGNLRDGDKTCFEMKHWLGILFAMVKV